MATKKKAAKKTIARAAPRKAKVAPIPDRYPPIAAYLCVDGAAAAIEFYKRAFGAKERMRMAAPGGKVGHAELVIGKGLLMLSDEWPEMGYRGPRALGGSPVTISMYVRDVDAVAKRAIDAGAMVKRPVEDQFYGDRVCDLEDPFGHRWHLATHIEDVSPREMKKRAEKLFGGG